MTVQSWAEARDRLARVLGGGRAGEAEAYEWLLQAIQASWSPARNERDLNRVRRSVGLQRAAGVAALLDDRYGDMLPFHPDPRGKVQAAFAKHWQGAMLEGPPWRLSPDEVDREPWSAWNAARSGDFG